MALPSEIVEPALGPKFGVFFRTTVRPFLHFAEVDNDPEKRPLLLFNSSFAGAAFAANAVANAKPSMTQNTRVLRHIRVDSANLICLPLGFGFKQGDGAENTSYGRPGDSTTTNRLTPTPVLPGS